VLLKGSACRGPPTQAGKPTRSDSTVQNSDPHSTRCTPPAHLLDCLLGKELGVGRGQRNDAFQNGHGPCQVLSQPGGRTAPHTSTREEADKIETRSEKRWRVPWTLDSVQRQWTSVLGQGSARDGLVLGNSHGRQPAEGRADAVRLRTCAPLPSTSETTQPRLPHAAASMHCTVGATAAAGPQTLPGPLLRQHWHPPAQRPPRCPAGGCGSLRVEMRPSRGTPSHGAITVTFSSVTLSPPPDTLPPPAVS